MISKDSYGRSEFDDDGDDAGEHPGERNAVVGQIHLYNENDDENSDDDGVEWDGSESELVSDDDQEGYEENQTGIKIKYKLCEEEVYEFLKHSKAYKKNRKLQKNHTIIQAILIILLMIFAAVMRSPYYAILTLFPVAAIVGIWVFPHISIRKVIKKFTSRGEVRAEVFPDKITIQSKAKECEIPLNGSGECEEFANMIIVYPRNSETIMIPIRSIDPEFLPDIQAMIFAGSRPRYED